MKEILGQTHVGFVAGTIRATETPISATIGQQFKMAGSPAPLYFTPDVAAQWIEELSKITEKSKK